MLFANNIMIFYINLNCYQLIVLNFDFVFANAAIFVFFCAQ